MNALENKNVQIFQDEYEIKPAELMQALNIFDNKENKDEEGENLEMKSNKEYVEQQDILVKEVKNSVILITREKTKNILKNVNLNVDVGYTHKEINSTYADINIKEGEGFGSAYDSERSIRLNNLSEEKSTLNLGGLNQRSYDLSLFLMDKTHENGHPYSNLINVGLNIDNYSDIGRKEVLNYIKNNYDEETYNKFIEYINVNEEIIRVKNRRNEIDIENEKIKNGEYELGIVGLNEFTSMVIDIFKESKDPFGDITEKLKDASEDEKIETARLLSNMLVKNYDDSMLENKSIGDVSDEEMLSSLKNYLNTGEEMSAGVCRHIHALSSKLLNQLGMKAALVSTNSGGRHAISVGKKENGEFFLIDYGDIYYGTDIKELKAKYLANKGSIDLKEWLSDADGNIIGNVETFLESKLREVSSLNGTPNMLDRSLQISKEGITHQEGNNFDANVSSEKDFNVSYKYGSKPSDSKKSNWEAGVAINNTTAVEGSLKSATVGGKLNIKDTKIGDISMGGSVGIHQVDYNTGNYSNLNTLNLAVDQRKELYNKKGYQINIGTSFEGTGLAHMKHHQNYEYELPELGAADYFEMGPGGMKSVDINTKNMAKGVYEDKNYTVDDGTMEIGTNLYGSKTLGKLNLEGNIGAKYDIGLNNLRSENGLKGYLGYQAGAGANYITNKGTKIGVGAQYQHVLGENRIKGGLDMTTKKGTVLFGDIEHISYTHDFGNETIKANLGLQQQFGDKVIAYIKGSIENRDSGYSEKQITVGAKIKL